MWTDRHAVVAILGLLGLGHVAAAGQHRAAAQLPNGITITGKN